MTRRVVAITGASAGIGRATAIRFGRDGGAIAADVTREADMERFVAAAVAPGFTDRIVQRFGRKSVR